MEEEIGAIIDKYKSDLSGLIRVDKEEIHFKHNNIECFGSRLSFVKDENFLIGFFSVVVGKLKTVHYFTLYQLPFCCAYTLSCGSFVSPKFQGKGVGSLSNKLRKDLSKAMGYSAMICTDVDSNERQRKILSKNGWNDIHSILNPRTNNLVHLSVVNLNE